MTPHFLSHGKGGKKKRILSWIGSIVSWGLAFFLVYALIQPDRFQVTAAPEDASDELLAYYDELEKDAQQIQYNGDIALNNLITLQGDDDTVTYTVSPGDTLSEIAKLFGTTPAAIREANDLENGAVLRVGQQLKIAYDKSIIYDMKETMPVSEFAQKYDINIDDLIVLNYGASEDAIFEKGQQIFVPLNRREAEERGLIEKKDFVMLELPQPSREPESVDIDGGSDVSPPIGDPSGLGEQQQVVITAAESQRRLEELEQAEKEAILAQKKAEEAAEKAEEARIAAEEEARKAAAEAAQKEEKERRAAEEAAEKAEEARIAAEEEARKAAAEAAQKEEIRKHAEAQRREQEAAAAEARRQAVADSCGSDQCYHEGKCRTKPANAVCAPTDPDNAWSCAEGYVDTGKACITENSYNQKTSQATGPKQSLNITNKRYFNPYNDGYGGNGRAGGHCTMYVGRWIRKNLGKHTNRRGNAKYRYDNAAAAGWEVGQTPKVGSIIVMKYGSQGWDGYGHVGIVKSINRDARQVFIEDMNYVGRYVVSQHRVDMDSKKNPVIGYIYP